MEEFSWIQKEFIKCLPTSFAESELFGLGSFYYLSNKI